MFLNQIVECACMKWFDNSGVHLRCEPHQAHHVLVRLHVGAPAQFYNFLLRQATTTPAANWLLQLLL